MKGKYLNLAEAYHFVLQRCNVPFYEYSVYSMLKKHGFVVKRCKLLHQANQKPTTSNDFDANQQVRNFNLLKNDLKLTFSSLFCKNV